MMWGKYIEDPIISSGVKKKKISAKCENVYL